MDFRPKIDLKMINKTLIIVLICMSVHLITVQNKEENASYLSSEFNPGNYF